VTPSLGWMGLAGGHELLLFVASALVLAATPGVDLLLTVTRTLQGGRRAGIATALGICSGCVVHSLAAAFGLATLLAVSGTAFTLVKWLGAAYLLYLAYGMLRSTWRSGAAQAPAEAAPSRSMATDFRVGLLTNVLNPKVALFFLAFLPQFVAPGTPSKTLAFLALGAVFVAVGAAFLLAVVLVTARLRRFGHAPRLRRWLNALAGGLFAALAVRLLFARQAAS
jgi:RhtB (resistance to homoserine/threonine) family protein